MFHFLYDTKKRNVCFTTLSAKKAEFRNSLTVAAQPDLPVYDAVPVVFYRCRSELQTGLDSFEMKMCCCVVWCCSLHRQRSFQVSAVAAPPAWVLLPRVLYTLIFVCLIQRTYIGQEVFSFLFPFISLV